MHTTTPHVPLLHTASDVARFLRAEHDRYHNGEALFRIVDHIGVIKAVKLWRTGVQIDLSDAPTAVCPSCGRLVSRLPSGNLEAHTDPRAYDRPCHQGGH